MSRTTTLRIATSAAVLISALFASTVSINGSPAVAATKKKAALPITVAAGFQVDILRSQGLGVPRAVLELKDGSLLVLDMGGWTKRKGRVLRVSRVAKTPPVVLFSKLDRPHGMIQAPNGEVYVGEAGNVFRFDPIASKPKRVDVIGGKSAQKALPLRAEHLHPLTALAYLRDGSLLVNFGSDSNNCANEAKTKQCTAAEGTKAVGTVRRYMISIDSTRATLPGSIFASGLRNSMAMVQHSSGTILQVENSRDSIDEADPKLSDEQLPHDELNELNAGKSYGWPYCYDNRVPSPEFKTAPASRCSTSEMPLELLPAHSAPLGMTYWTGSKAPKALAGSLVITYHGYRDTGHRVVAFPVDASGRPNGPSKELIGGWAETDDYAPGGPVGVVPTRDGSLLIVDDRNGLLLELKSK
jgi:glucose/arabinose dehydrogenase